MLKNLFGWDFAARLLASACFTAAAGKAASNLHHQQPIVVCHGN